MTQLSEQDKPRNDSSGLSSELDNLAGEPETAHKADNPDAQLAVIRGEAVPVIRHNGVEASQHTGTHRRASDTSATSRISSLTVSDRGESSYRAEHPLESPQPTNGESAMPADQSPDPLVNRLLRLKVQSSQCKRDFFYPRSELEALITAREVARVIRQGRPWLEEANKVLTDDEIHEYASRVCRDTLPDGTYVSYKRAFAILLLIRRGWDIVLFVDQHIHDAELPLKAVKAGDELRMRRQSDSETDLPCLRTWDALDHENFEDRQWSMLAPFLAKGDRRCAWFYQLSDKDVLPWTSKESCVREGGYGSISRVKIHPSHHNFDGGNGVFAVKEFKPVRAPPTPGTDLSKDFEREIEILMRFSGEVHQHLISLQAAYRHGDTYCVILPWAECDLKNLFKTSLPRDPLHKPNLLWLLGQSLGIASGLQSIHLYTTTEPATHEKADASPRNNRIFGRHGDIKPENILLFRDHRNSQDLGTLVLADFGLSRFHSEITKTYFSYKDIITSITYRPPECDMEGRNVSRSFDIWSLGCVLLEFVAWYLGGSDLVNDFVNCRKTLNPLYPGWQVDDFFEIVRHEGSSPGTVYVRVKCEVHYFVNNKLHAHQKCSKPIHDLLDLVMQKMLVVESQGILKRANCGELHAALQAIYQTVSSLQTLTANPRPKVDSLPEAVEMPLDLHARQIKYMELRRHTGRTRTLPANGLQYHA